MNRRSFMKNAFLAGLGCTFLPNGLPFSGVSGKKKVIVLGIDGMDPHLTLQYSRQGLLPNLTRIAGKGRLSPLATSTPPQSPVAWSNVIVGASPKTHGIYDFIHRIPTSMKPYLSTSRIAASPDTLDLGDYKIPLGEGRTELLRQGKAFWEYLSERDIPSTIFKMPANFPCKDGSADMVSGIGTPDLRGGYGNYTLFSTEPERYKKNISTGKLIPVSFTRGRMDAVLPGPVNSLKKDNPTSNIPVTVWRDRKNPVIRINIGDNELILKEGEWTEWLSIDFPLLGSLVQVSGIIKLFVKSVHPHFSMYVSPINIDPTNPALPIASSSDYLEELTGRVGYFYTQGFPEDTKALSEIVLDEDEYLQLANQILRERQQLLRAELERFRRVDQGLLFFYFSSLDQNSHMYWRAIDPLSPLYNSELHRRHGQELKRLYAEVDNSIGEVLADYDLNDPNVTILLMSDHGFNPFRRQVNLNTWLYEQGFLALSSPRDLENNEFFKGVIWSRTGAYNLGINSLYLNRKGRELEGLVAQGQAAGLLKALRDNLLEMRDPDNGEKTVATVRIVPEEERNLQPHAPDLIVGWNRGYRTSWGSILGGFNPDTVFDNTDKWSGDHCVAPGLVPGILVSNKPVRKNNPSLKDIAPTILAEFGIPVPAEMEGKPVGT